MDSVIDSIRKELKSSGDEKIRIQQEHFFKEDVKFYGLNAVGIRAISNSVFRSLPDKSKQVIFGYCEDLFGPNIFEESAIACEWSYKVHKQYKPEDFATFDSWVKKYVTNWAICDSLCNHTVGTLVEMYPELISGLKKWAASDKRWVRRASAVSLIIPARKGLFQDDIFEIADILHASKDDMVQKGYGWMLKAASQADCDKVFAYVMSRKATMPRTSLRYAIEKMPAELKSLAMAK